MTLEREILVIHPGALGDVLQAVPALRALRGLDGGSRVALAAQPRLGRLLLGAREIDEALSFDGLGLERLFSDGGVPAALGARLAAARRVVSWFGARDARYVERLRSLAPSAAIAAPVPEESSGQPVWRSLLSTLAGPGIAGPALVTPLALPEAWRHQARHALAGLGIAPEGPVLTVHAGSGAAWKRWPAPALAEVIGRVSRAGRWRVVIHEGPADREAATELDDALRGQGADLSRSRLVEPELALLAGILQASAAFLGADSGVSQLAAAVGAPAVILYPPATREGWAPWSPTALPLLAGSAEASVERVSAALLARAAP